MSEKSELNSANENGQDSLASNISYSKYLSI